MKKPQISTGAGILTILAGFLAVYQDVRLTEFMSVFVNLTFGQVVTMLLPFISGIVAIAHNEDKG